MSAITVTMSLDTLDTKHPGYQPPLPADQVRMAACLRDCSALQLIVRMAGCLASVALSGG